MKFRIFSIFLGTTLLFSISCAHTEKGDEADGQDSEMSTEEVAAADSGDTKKTPSDDLNQLSQEGGQPPAATNEAAAPPANAEAASPPAGAAAETKTADASSKLEDDLTNLDSAPLEDGKKADEHAATTPPPGSSETATPPPATNEAGNSPAVDSAAASLEATSPQTADATSTTPPPGIDMTPPASPQTDMAAAVPEATMPSSEAKAPHAPYVASVPKIPGSALHKKGAMLNRFYFTRRGDTAKSVSELLYGDTAHAKSLMKWNPSAKKMLAGTLIYYQSPSQPHDKQMRSFYQERSINPDEYTVQRGDWLSKVAATKLGSSGSWKEIAVVNGMDSPNSLEVGKKIAIYPKDLSNSTGSNTQVAEETVPAEPPPTAPKVTNERPQTPPPPSPQQPMEPPPVTQAAPPIVPAPEEPMRRPPVVSNNNGNNVNISKVVEQNFFAVAIGVLIVFLLVLLTALNRRKRSRRDDLSDDFASPKAKRK